MGNRTFSRAHILILDRTPGNLSTLVLIKPSLPGNMRSSHRYFEIIFMTN